MTARVLVVDDIQLNVKVLEAKLSAEYFEVITALNGEEAIAAVNEQHPDIVLLDVMMPGMDGFEVCERIRANPNTTHIPIVMVTALSEAAERVRGLEAGADDFLTKPVDDTALFTRVRTLVRLKTMMDELRLREETSTQLGVSGAAAVDGEDFSNSKVLVVDDDSSDSKLIEEALSSYCGVTVEPDAEKAVELAHSGEFDLAVVSLIQRDADGLRLCSQLRSAEETRQMSLLALAPKEDNALLVRALDLGVNDYLAKPIDRNELRARVRTQLRRKIYQDKLRRNYQDRMVMAVTDSLTGLHNRRYLESHLDTAVSRATEGGKPAAILMLDIDHFKAVNDTYGHPIGDEVLVECAKRIQICVRGVDLAVRYGGEEFVVIVPDTTLDIAQIVAERLRASFAGQPFPVSADVGELPVTISIGVAITGAARETGEDLLRRADEALYEAKRTGRNRIVMAEPADGVAPQIPNSA
ncbi:MAG: PleD family two-component system response regulator [Proteobacteria bacterium]|nr:PleD family two-component system response regulator [Pseudomonadota bacterium]